MYLMKNFGTAVLRNIEISYFCIIDMYYAKRNLMYSGASGEVSTLVNHLSSLI